MKYGETGEQSRKRIKVYRRGLISVPEVLQSIITEIESGTAYIDDTDTRIAEQGKLYRYALRKLLDNFRD